MNPLKTPHEILLEEAGAVPATPGLVNTPQQMLMQQANVMPHFAPGGKVFDPQGFDYDYQTALAHGMGPNGTGENQGHWGSVAPVSDDEQQLHDLPEDSYVVLKGKSHPTFYKAEAAENERGSKIVKHGDRYYSVPQNLSPADMQASMIVNGQTPQRFAGGSLVKNIATQTAYNAPFFAEDAMDIAHDIKNKKYKEAAAKTAGVGYSAFTPLNPLTALISGLTYSPEVGDATLDAYKQKQAEHAAEVSARAQALSPVFKWNKPATLDEMQQEVLGYPNIPLPKVK